MNSNFNMTRAKNSEQHPGAQFGLQPQGPRGPPASWPAAMQGVRLYGQATCLPLDHPTSPAPFPGQTQRKDWFGSTHQVQED